MFKKMPIILLALIGLIIAIDRYIPIGVKSVMYALSLSIKSAIIFILPFLIFMLLFKTISQLSKGASKMILLILAAICCSNFLSVMVSYQIGSAVYNLNLSLASPQGVEALAPAWTFSLPKLIANNHAMFGGICLGLLFSFFNKSMGQKIAFQFEKIVGKILAGLTLAIPFFITGFVMKLIHEKMIKSIITDYSLIFLLVTISTFAYIALFYFVGSRFQFSRFSSNIKNMLPAAITGFTSMSSAAAMPLTLIAAEKNAGKSSLLTIPLTVNTHLMGDCFAIPIFAFAVMKNFGMAEPTFMVYLLFAFYFVMAKFSVAAIPGGTIIVMLPILESQLGFTGEMASLITALCILFDPIVTCANISGNGGFATVLSRINKFKTIEA
ncbi:MAG: cation:dicarboxylase symporter family transporter [Verrucomicrobia bacterium]|nr:cation:dicarboxylase symporter family transporter [Verrucomicrobiota bacterium]